ncbi:MAG: alpha/beta hydrolase [Ramlibacter sp.]
MLESMYNNRARVPDHPRYFSRWAGDSARVRRTADCVPDRAYGDGPDQLLDVFPAPRPAAPVLVFIHGGWWRSLDKHDHSFIAPAFTAAGVCVVMPNYTLAPTASVPGITLQMVQALAWTFRNIASFGGDPARICVAGHSAGGQLAAMLLACLWPLHGQDLPADLVKGALSVSGLHDLTPIMHTPFLQKDLKLTPRQVRKASPALLPAPPAGALAAVCGGDESAEFHRQRELIRAAWGAQRVPVCEALPGLDHFSVVDALAQPDSRLHRIAAGLLRL